VRLTCPPHRGHLCGAAAISEILSGSPDANPTPQAYLLFEICVVYNGGFPTAAPEFSLPKFSVVKPAP
jgi:hypothetical protein